MVHRLSVLFVGTSAARRAAVECALLERGHAVSFGVQAEPDGVLAVAGEHDVIAYDTPAGIRIVTARKDVAPRRELRVESIDALPDAIVALFGGQETRQASPSVALEELRELIAGLPGVVLRCGLDAGGCTQFMSEQVAELCGHRRPHFIGHGSERLLATVHAADRRRLMMTLQRALRTQAPFAFEHRIVCANGAEKWVWHRGCVRDREDGGHELESFVVDISERKREEQQLAYLANHDALTGVANRSLFMEQLGKSLQRADRHGEMIACLFLDLDRFKRINDTFGHAFGDALLQEVSVRLKRCVRGNDLVGRLGGDEFTVLLDGIAEPKDAAAAANKILEELQRPLDIRGRRFAISASIGISCYPGDAQDRAALLRNADAAMYNVKSSGRRGYRFYAAEMSSQAFETLALANGLRAAIESGGLDLHYQPRVNLRTGRVSALEVLARWDSDTFGEVAPGRFIALAEDVGLIGALGDWLLHETCHRALARDGDALPGTRVAVNLSARQFRDDGIVGQVARALQDTGLPAARLEIEVPEAAMMLDPAASADVLRALKSLGVTLSVDDFGTGRSSLQLLRKFPLDYLKVDRSFIRGVPGDADDVAVTEAIIAMARILNLGVVAEGIETEAQGVFVRSSGCDEAQGYLFSRPVADPEIRHYLRRRVH